MKIWKVAEEGKIKEFLIQNDVLWYGNRFYVTNILDLKKESLKEARNSALTTHLGSTQMYHDLKTHLWWVGRKRDIVDFVARYLTYQKVKIEH